MAAGHDSSTVDEQGAHEHPGGDEPVGGHDDHGHGSHDDHGHDDHHDDHGSGGDAWVLIPIAVGLVIGLVLALFFGLASGVDGFVS
jgi:NADH-quinone oxidoreductase subunit L